MNSQCAFYSGNIGLMQITKFSDFALRILIHLAAADGEPSSRHGTLPRPRAYRSITWPKIAQWLAAEGYVVATRGRGGGMRLARAPVEISIGDSAEKDRGWLTPGRVPPCGRREPAA